MMPDNMTSGSVYCTTTDGKQTEYQNATNVSLGKDWAFIRFEDGSRVQIPVMIIKELFEDSGVFVKGVKHED